ncbi:avidin-like [Protopterus annectens]|uniref:avidin-like n=1 Tax=Protopterus annectens TaxID=7888 RepID=UPI001CFBFA3C|nr:avidin-like [Protopterus annectens]
MKAGKWSLRESRKVQHSEIFLAWETNIQSRMFPEELFLLGLCILTGTWMNDYHCNVTIGKVDADSIFRGNFYIPVPGSRGVESKGYPLIGIQNLGASPTFAFVVNVAPTNSVSGLVGQCFINKTTGKEILKTKWILRTSAADISDDWKQTMVFLSIVTVLKESRKDENT